MKMAEAAAPMSFVSLSSDMVCWCIGGEQVTCGKCTLFQIGVE